MAEVVNLFSDFFAIENLNNIDNEGIIKYIEGLSEKDNGVKISNVGGHQTKPLRGGESDSLDKLIRLVNRTVNDTVVSLGFKPVELTGVWGNLNYTYCYNQAHRHFGSIVSAVYYPRSLPNQGNIILQREDVPSLALQNVAVNNTEYTQDGIGYQPNSSDLIIFPGWLKHLVEPNLTDTSRVSLAFNYNIAGIPN